MTNTTMGMVERVAKAIWQERERRLGPRGQRMEPDAMDMVTGAWASTLADARVAIGAMAEPTKPMEFAGGTKLEEMLFNGDRDYSGVIFKDVGVVYRTMLRAALQEE